MRILHTSDWHLGRTLHGVDLHEAHTVFLDHLVEVARDRDVDVVVVAGDVYDRAVPAVASVKLLSDALSRLSEVATIVITPGNHDSGARLGFAAGLMRPGVHILAQVERLHEPVVISDEAGPVAFYGVPYLEPDLVRDALAPAAAPTPGSEQGAQDATPRLARSHEAVVGAALDRIRDDLAGRPGTRSVAAAHAFVVGGARTESERDIRVGGVDSVPSEVFEGLDYVALGHLHGAQRVGPADGPALRYSGSPLAFSFGEKGQVKSTAIVDLAADGTVAVELVPTPVPRRLAEVTGDLADLLSGAHDDLADAWLRVFVTDPVHPAGLHARIRERFPHALSIQHTPVGGPAVSRRRAITPDTDPVAVATDFVAFATGGAATDAETAVLRAAYEQARAAEGSA
ncbi:exonuclease sbcCD subunit D [Frondihabitans sp. PAMC 28766]|uniref:exonuclease SbcCD subunit D n=1 Tax=Frondihabitans sp. PAMC 28766 TaxID=1795630 RepID=UPI00078C10C0|nr:exonuclease SbcCD subunit D C-terminal domain-containing protein [Frondihabitans sp. PAMC 28766]AMM19099.1 exonuclease sbcCD subunit D [Frondihabitans sp. PAMC 28766]